MLLTGNALYEYENNSSFENCFNNIYEHRLYYEKKYKLNVDVAFKKLTLYMHLNFSDARLSFHFKRR